MFREDRKISTIMVNLMTDQEMNIAVAKACGWKRVSVYTWMENRRLPKEWINVSDIPDYGSDLNACAEMEMFLEVNRTNMCWRYTQAVKNIINPRIHLVGDFRLINAPASQRREAFLRTIGKFVD